jgi:hypothetical protein
VKCGHEPMAVARRRREATCTQRPRTGPDTRRYFVSTRTAYEGFLERKDKDVAQALSEIQSMHLGRFSEGMEQLPETPDKRHVGHFSEGIEQLPETPGKRHVGRFSEGIEQLPQSEWNLRLGSFADGLREAKQRRANVLSRRHPRRPEARGPRHSGRVRGGRTGV